MLRILIAALAAISSFSASAKPIAFQSGTTAMYEYGAGTMQEAQAFYAPLYWMSAGAGYLRLDADDGRFSRDLSYARANFLLKRWNMPDAQANVFAWGSAGAARGSDFSGTRALFNAGAQADYETRRVYGSLKTDWLYASTFSNRIDTLQLGLAPYKHRYDQVATWFVVQARDYTGGIYDGVETAGLIRLFRAWSWGSVWIEAGATIDGKVQAMTMFNF
jgi:hypothetical protein